VQASLAPAARVHAFQGRSHTPALPHEPGLLGVGQACALCGQAVEAGMLHGFGEKNMVYLFACEPCLVDIKQKRVLLLNHQRYGAGKKHFLSFSLCMYSRLTYQVCWLMFSCLENSSTLMYG